MRMGIYAFAANPCAVGLCAGPGHPHQLSFRISFWSQILAFRMTMSLCMMVVMAPTEFLPFWIIFRQLCFNP